MFFAEYSNGETAKIYQVKVFFERTHLIIEGVGFNYRWDYSELNRAEKSRTTFLIFKGDNFPFENLSFLNLEAFYFLEKIAPEICILQESHFQFERIGKKAYLFGLIGIAIVLSFLHLVIIPFTVKTIATNFPKDMEAKLGENYMGIAEEYGVIDNNKTKIIQCLSGKIDFDTEYDLTFYVVESDYVNAFALPGGRIIVFTALIDSMTSFDQLISLMGHEAGHVELRHSIQSIFREQSYNIVLNAISGGNSEVVSSIIGTASSLNTLHGSRKHEKEADRYALKVLVKNNCDPKGVVELFEILAKGGENYIPDILSTHPNPKLRIEELNAQINELEEFIITPQDSLQVLFDLLKTPLD